MISISMKQLLEAGVHFGHQSRRWNPKMARYIYTERNGIYIIDLKKTLRMLRDAYKFVADTVAAGGTILFVGTKKQAKEPMEEAAKACNMYYVTSRWLGGMLTNFTTISRSIDRLKSLDRMFEDGTIERYSKKMRAQLGRERVRLERNLGGIKNMKNLPTAMFVLDPMKESIAISEARKLHIPIIAVVDTNCDPDPVDLVIPGNDDAIRAVALFAQKMSEAVLEGLMARVAAGEEIELPPAAEALREAALAQAEESEEGDDAEFGDDLIMGGEVPVKDEEEDDFDVSAPAPEAAPTEAPEAKAEEAPAAAAPEAEAAPAEEKPKAEAAAE